MARTFDIYLANDDLATIHDICFADDEYGKIL